MASDPTPNQPAIADSISDVVSLERHFEDVLDLQITIDAAPAIISTIHDTVHDSRMRAEDFRESYSDSPAMSVLKQDLDLLGKAISLIESVRKETISNSLRNDFVACNLAAVSYSMLHTTAIALENEDVAAFAAEGLRTYARLITEIGIALPSAVVRELVGTSGAESIDANAAAIATSQQQGLWSPRS